MYRGIDLFPDWFLYFTTAGVIIHYPSYTDSIKLSLQLSCKIVVINASEGSLCFQISFALHLQALVTSNHCTVLWSLYLYTLLNVWFFWVSNDIISDKNPYWAKTKFFQMLMGKFQWFNTNRNSSRYCLIF
jgi:hypothetical protein